eukprot:1083089-Amphidinium_carterae.1
MENPPNSRLTLLMPPKAIVTLLGLDSDWVWVQRRPQLLARTQNNAFEKMRFTLKVQEKELN